MANIDKYITQLKDFSTNGNKARGIMIDACEAINKGGTNSNTLQGYDSKYFISAMAFSLITKPYLRKIGLVNDLDRIVDENGKKTILTQTYKNNTVVTPFDTTPGVVVIKPSTAGEKFDVTLPTSNAIWLKLGYSDLSDLEDYIRS